MNMRYVLIHFHTLVKIKNLVLIHFVNFWLENKQTAQILPHNKRQLCKYKHYCHPPDVYFPEQNLNILPIPDPELTISPILDPDPRSGSGLVGTGRKLEVIFFTNMLLFAQ